MKKVIFLIISFFIVFICISPIKLNSSEPTYKDTLKESIHSLKINNLKLSDLQKLDLKIREITSSINGKDFIYTYKTNTNKENLINELNEFIKLNNLEEKYLNSNINIETIKVLESINNIKDKLNKYKYEVL